MTSELLEEYTDLDAGAVADEASDLAPGAAVPQVHVTLEAAAGEEAVGSAVVEAVHALLVDVARQADLVRLINKVIKKQRNKRQQNL